MEKPARSTSCGDISCQGEVVSLSPYLEKVFALYRGMGYIEFDNDYQMRQVIRLNTIYQKIHQSDYRLTPQRAAVLEVMVENQGRHLSAEDVYREARRKSPNLGIATVYRTLEKLAGMNVLYKTMFEGGRYRYELSLGEEHQHHHMICVVCGAIAEVEEDLLHILEKRLEQQGFQVIDHELKFYGYCPDCAPKK